MLDSLWAWLGKFWKKLLDWFWWLLDSLFMPLHWLADGIFYLLKTILFLIIDGFFTVAELFFLGIDSASFDFLSSPSLNLHPTLIWFVYQLGIVQGISIIASALAVRLLLNFIPSTITRI